MAERRTAPAKQAPSDEKAEMFISSGSTLLNCCIGGGWASRRISNIVGDRAAGKTLLAIEATANYAARFGVANCRYAEAEAALDESYARRIGLPPGLDVTSGIATVELFFRDISAWADSLPVDPKVHRIYVLDSLDALSDTDELARDIDKGSYGQGKAKAMSEFFRRLTQPLAAKNIHLMVISQIRDKIGVTFGETKTRSGGRALDFYASQIIWIAGIGKIMKTVAGNERAIGEIVRVNCKKLKVGMAYRKVDLEIIYGYGIDDEVTMIDWLKKEKILPHHLLSLGNNWEEVKKRIRKARQDHDRTALNRCRQILSSQTEKRWETIEAALRPPMGKYA